MAENKRESVGNLNVKVDVDVSEAIKGLKAVQREVKETVRSLAELDAAMRGDEKTPNNRRKGGCGTVESPYALDWRRGGIDSSE
ncbi:hypothetical protein [Bacillus sp. FSL K6-2971]|uniref:hypothetical protein n=1 Tax=Bacillus sp. FSL K6-2971 TaxID=2921487 RepID=UPI0030F7E98A